MLTFFARKLLKSKTLPTVYFMEIKLESKIDITFLI